MQVKHRAAPLNAQANVVYFETKSKLISMPSQVLHHFVCWHVKYVEKVPFRKPSHIYKRDGSVTRDLNASPIICNDFDGPSNCRCHVQKHSRKAPFSTLTVLLGYLNILLEYIFFMIFNSSQILTYRSLSWLRREFDSLALPPFCCRYIVH